MLNLLNYCQFVSKQASHPTVRQKDSFLRLMIDIFSFLTDTGMLGTMKMSWNFKRDFIGTSMSKVAQIHKIITNNVDDVDEEKH